MPKSRLRHLNIRCEDVEASARFLMETLGLERVVDDHPAGQVHLSDGEVNFALAPLKGHPPGILHIGFTVDEPGETRKELFAHGARQLDPVSLKPMSDADLAARPEFGGDVVTRNVNYISPGGLQLETGNWRYRVRDQGHAEAGARVRLCSVSDVPPGEMRWFIHAGLEILVANIGGRFYAMDNVCPHAGGSLAEGYLDDDVVTCAMHNWEFDVKTGRCLANPDGFSKPIGEGGEARCQRTYAVTLEGNDLVVGIAEAVKT